MDKKEIVLNLLKENKILSTGKIAYLISSNQYSTMDLLRELEKEGKIKKEEQRRGTYWSLKK